MIQPNSSRNREVDGRRPTKSCRQLRSVGFTLTELLVVIVIVAVLGALVFALARKGLEAAAKAEEVNAAKNLLATYQTATQANGRFLPGYDRSVGEVELPNGKVVGGPIAQRYPFRLAAAASQAVEDIALHGENERYVQPGQDYLMSLHPTFGINRYFVGGDIQTDGSISYRADCATHMGMVSSAIIVFASAAMSRDNGDVVEGFNHLTPPNLTGPMWSASDWSSDAKPEDYGHVHARHNGKAVVGFLDGSVKLLDIETLRDMRLWNVKAKRENKPDYTVPRTGGGRL